MSWRDWVEVLSYVVTVFGFPFAIIIFIYEKRRELQNEEEELHQRLSDEYVDFLKLVLDNSDLQLLRKQANAQKLTDEQNERKLAVFGILISLFERAYILVYEEKMNKQTKRLWFSWEDYMRDWCRREDFRAVLPELLEGEDEDFRRHIMKIAESEKTKTAHF
jgi:succinate dehydrogenase flavin-adding protein (antitoxin of CptAB toxin-antitoxin module)